MDEKQKLISKLKSSPPESRYEILAELMNFNLDEPDLFELTGFLTDENRNLRFLAGDILLKYDDSLVTQKIIELISSPDISIRNYSGELLIKFGERSTSPLIEFLSSDRNNDDIKFAVDILGLIGSDLCEPLVINILNKTKNENVILSCIETLGNIKSQKATSKLIPMYGKNYLFDPAIIEALGKIGSPEILSFLYSIYNKVDELEKFIIIESLGETGDEETFFFLLSELNESRGPLSWTILKSISLLKTKYNFDIPFDEKMKNLILEAINESDEEIKNISLLMLAEFNDKESTLVCLRNYGLNENLIGYLKQKLELNPSFIMSHVAEVIKESPFNIYHLLCLVTEILIGKPDIGDYLKTVELREFVSVLIEMLNFPDEEVRILAAELLFKLDEKTALLFVDSLSEDTSMWNRMRLIELLEQVDSPVAVEIIKKMTSDPEEMVSDRARDFLESRGVEFLNKIELPDDAT
jgi:HEAT repeat protein